MPLADTPRRRMHAKRTAWLLTHQDDLAALPGETDDVSEAQHAALERVEQAMVADGLFARGQSATDAYQRRCTIRRLVTEIRKGRA